MNSINLKVRALYGAAALTLTLLVAGGSTPAPASCQEPPIVCMSEGHTRETRDDGSVWNCFKKLNCGTFRAEDICFREQPPRD